MGEWSGRWRRRRVLWADETVTSTLSSATTWHGTDAGLTPFGRMMSFADPDGYSWGFLAPEAELVPAGIARVIRRLSANA